MGETSSPEFHCVFVETSLNTRLVLLVHKDEIISDFKDKLLKEHKKVFPEIGEINVSALKVKRRRQFFHFSDSMSVWEAFYGIHKSWFMYVDAVRVEKGDEVLTIMAADQNCSKLELVEGKKEISIGMHTKDLTLEEGLKTDVAEKKTKKRKIISSDGKTSRKKLMIGVNKSSVASGSCVVSLREQVDDIVTGAMGKDIESGENKDISVGENQQTFDADRQLEGKILVVNSEIVDMVKDVPDSETLNGVQEKPDDHTGAIVEDIGKGEKNAELVKNDQENDLQTASELVDGQITSRDEGSRLAPSAADNLQTAELVTYVEKQLESSSGLTTGTATEKKRKRKKSSKDHINQSSAATFSTPSREIVKEINGVPGNVDCVDVASESRPISRKENLGKENEMGEKTNEDVGSGKALSSSVDTIQTNNFAGSGLTTGPATEKKRRKKSSKDHINQSTAAATTPSREIVNDGEKVSGSIDRVNATSESFPRSIGEKFADTLIDAMQNEDEIGDKFVDKMGSTEATLTSADKIQAVNNLQVVDLVSTPHTLVQESKTLDNIGKSTDENKSREREVSKENVEIDADQAKSVKSTKKKCPRKAKTTAKEDTLVDSGVQNVEPIKVVDGEGPDNVIRNVLDSLQQSLDKSGKKSSKSSNKKQSLNVVDAQELDSLQQKNETETDLDESGKKSIKRSKKKHSSNTVEPQVLSVEVNNAAQKEAPPTNNPKDTDALFTPAKKDIESDASHLEKSIQVADYTEDNNPSKQILKENADMGDNFGSSQKKDDIVGGGNKQVQMTGGAKTKKEKNLGGSIDGKVKPKERKSRVQPANSGTSILQSGVKNDRSGPKVVQADASVKASVNNKKDAVKKSSNSVTVNKSKMNVNNKKEAVKKSSNSITVNKSKMNFFKDADKSNSSDDESKKTSDVSTNSPSDSSTDDDSDVTSMSRKQGNNLSGGTHRFLGSLQDILRSSKSYKKAKLTASQSQPDEFDGEIPGLDFVPDSQAN
ncbi:hypothetical protein V5N11_001994 [Cardamine amara subsp. amara]|uniref:COP1-interacting protein 4.1 n=1 Tax=Cardamine amara subsp. amara TaxID=228776 RepID=A0ABD0ZR58_CARAN